MIPTRKLLANLLFGKFAGARAWVHWKRHGDALRACRYCRYKPPSITLTDNMAQVTCPNCYAAGPAFVSAPQGGAADAASKAMGAWNRRN